MRSPPTLGGRALLPRGRRGTGSHGAGHPRVGSLNSCVWRHLRLSDVHPDAELAAQAPEAAGDQGGFWEMHDLLLANQDHVGSRTSWAAGRLGLDVPAFERQLYAHVHAAKVGQDVESADISGVSGTPTFFINGRRRYGAFDAPSLTTTVLAWCSPGARLVFAWCSPWTNTRRLQEHADAHRS